MPLPLCATSWPYAPPPARDPAPPSGRATWAHPFLLQAVLGVLAWLTHSLSLQYVGALEDMLQALKIQAR